jgi:hypothetical protein
VRGSDPDVLNTSLLLTYCFEVGSGLHYLSSRRVVHRDIAARNVRSLQHVVLVVMCLFDRALKHVHLV